MEVDRNSRDRRDADGPVVGQTGARFGGSAGRRRRTVVEPPEDDGAGAAHASHADLVVGQTGARFPSLFRRRRHQEQDYEQQAAEPTGAQRPPGQQQAVPPPEIALPASEPDRLPEPHRLPEPDWVEGTGWDAPKETYGLVRPYTLTGGRTASRVDLELETLVSATGQGSNPADRPEHSAILRLCAIPRSVAEIAALLKTPLGVARVLLGDLADAGSIAVHRTAGSADAPADVALMRRVLAGLQRL